MRVAVLVLLLSFLAMSAVAGEGTGRELPAQLVVATLLAATDGGTRATYRCPKAMR